MLKKYTYEITETLRKNVTVYALDEDEAYKKLRKAYHNCDIILDETNYVGTEIHLLDKNK